FCREALVWQRLRHPYIVPLIGIDTESFPLSLCMVSPWMKNGTSIKYLSGMGSHERQTTVDRLLSIISIREIAQGLALLHDQHIVHGDLRGSNILVDDDGHACLIEFGLTVLSDETISQTNHGVRWMAPETLDPTLTDLARTPAGDIYAFACVCLELYTGYPPFHALHDAAVMFQVVGGMRPGRPARDVIPDHIWNIMEQCWAHNSADRPTILGIVLELDNHGRCVLISRFLHISDGYSFLVLERAIDVTIWR
ncbi:kinase-like domain-containing protein, partial [Mycena leptocephala]